MLYIPVLYCMQTYSTIMMWLIWTHFPLGSPSLRSPTENSIASLVSAAAIVKAKSESEGEGQVSTGKQCVDALDTVHVGGTACYKLHCSLSLCHLVS